MSEVDKVEPTIEVVDQTPAEIEKKLGINLLL
jgi:hypothetical protein